MAFLGRSIFHHIYGRVSILSLKVSQRSGYLKNCDLQVGFWARGSRGNMCVHGCTFCKCSLACSRCQRVCFEVSAGRRQVSVEEHFLMWPCWRESASGLLLSHELHLRKNRLELQLQLCVRVSGHSCQGPLSLLFH